MTSDNHESTGKQTDVASLTPDERRVLAVLVAVGGAWVTPEQLASLSEIDDVGPVLVELERRGLVRKDERGRRAAAAGLSTQLRQALGVLDTADRVLRQLISIAEDGRLTLDDLDAVLGITGWAAEVGRLHGVASAGRSRPENAHGYGAGGGVAADRPAGGGGRSVSSATRRRRRGPTSSCGRANAHSQGGPLQPPLRPGLRLGLATLALAGAAVVGFVAASAVGAEAGPAGPTVTLPGQTVTRPGETITLRGSTVTVGGETVTLPGSTLPGETATEPAKR